MPICCGVELEHVGNIGWSKWYTCRKCRAMFMMNRRTKTLKRVKDC